MPQLIIYLNEDNNLIVNYYSKEWELSKHETILKIIKDYGNNTLEYEQEKEEIETDA